MIYNFDEIIDRRGTDSLKLEALLPRWGREDLIPMWVADMDFKTPPFIVKAVKKRIECEIFGYTEKPLAWYQSIIDWQKKRHQLSIDKEMICFIPGVVPALVMAIEAFTHVGDNVLIQPPVYYPFAAAIRNTGRKVVTNPLLLQEGQYHIDFEDFEARIRSGKVDMFVLCNPQNPTGRVFTREELTRMADICAMHHVVIVSDEIHSDIIYSGENHTPIASIAPDIGNHCLTLIAPSKTFNIPGFAGNHSGPNAAGTVREGAEGAGSAGQPAVAVRRTGGLSVWRRMAEADERVSRSQPRLRFSNGRSRAPGRPAIQTAGDVLILARLFGNENRGPAV